MIGRGTAPGDFQAIEIPVEATFALRHAVLRGDRADLPLRMPDDDVAGAFHVAVAGPSGVPVGVGTAVPTEPEFEAMPPSWRLRQMAVEPTMRGKGIGSALFGALVDRIRQRGGATVWAEARDTSLSFYDGRGMTAVSGRAHSDGGVAYTDVVMPLDRS